MSGFWRLVDADDPFFVRDINYGGRFLAELIPYSTTHLKLWDYEQDGFITEYLWDGTERDIQIYQMAAEIALGLRDITPFTGEIEINVSMD